MRPSIIFGSLALVLFIGIGIYLFPLNPNILYLQFAFSEPGFNAVLSQWQPDGVALYRAHFPADFLFMTLYAVSGYRYGMERAHALRSQPLLSAVIKWALPLTAVADAAEDVLHIIILSSAVESVPIFYLLSGISSSLKWLGIFIFFAGIIYAIKKHKQ